MAKKNKDLSVENGGLNFVKRVSGPNASPVEKEIAKYRRKGKLIKLETKKETKVAKWLCNHHYINDKGKLRDAIYFNNNMICCEMCGAAWGTDIPTVQKIKSVMKEFKALLDFAKFTTTAIDCGTKAKRYYTEVSLATYQFEKITIRLAEIASKDYNKKKGKKNKGDKHGGNISPGVWKIKQ